MKPTMKRVRMSAAIAFVLSGLLSAFVTAAAPPVPIVVELFTSEGCSSCPPADAFLQKLVDTQPLEGAQIIALGEHVDYWDRQGWKDRFSSAALTNRQQGYSARFNTESIYTPQMVVDGRAEFVGSDAAAAKKALERARTVPHGIVRIVLDPKSATGAPPAARSVAVAVTASDLPSGGDRADVILAVTEDHLRSDVTRGENHGRVLTHAAVVRYLAAAGEAARGVPTTVRAEIPIGSDWQPAQLKVVAFVQERRSRAILAAAELPVAVR